MYLSDLLKVMIEKEASDLHLKVGSPPFLRVHGHLMPIEETSPLTKEDVESLSFEMMDDWVKEKFNKKKEVDFAFDHSSGTRFRVNVHMQKGTICVAMRLIPTELPDFQMLNLPETIIKLADEPRGLVLVTGTAGSGKTTTLAAMIDHINSSRREHIVTIEDPLEVIHKDKLSIISQREIGIDTDSYTDALKHVVRQDPDVILIGEMRDKETMEAAISAAEMGNLILSTLHTIDTTETINRIIDFFQPHEQRQVRISLASTLRGIVSLRLLPKIGGGRIPAVEVMVNTATTREFVLKQEETHKIKDAIEQGEYYGMQTFEQSLIRLYQEGKVKLEDAQLMAANPQDFKLTLRQMGIIY